VLRTPNVSDTNSLRRDLPGAEWESFYRRELPRLWRSLLAYSASSEIASDAAAEAFARSYDAWPELRDPVAWVFRVGFRIAAKELAHRERTGHPLPERQTAPPDVGVDVMATLRRLSPSQRAALLLSDYYGFGSRDIATFLSCSPSTARVHIARARRSFRRMVEDRFAEEEVSS
jgi:DNA-directed RNA polymerase specialized sigma24 family protein